MIWRYCVIGWVCLQAAVAVAPSARAEPPTLSEWPSTLAAMPDEYFWLSVTFFDPDGDLLDIHVENAPPWATSWTFQSGGTCYVFLYGVPTTPDEGIYSNVRVLASDGQTAAATPPLEISVGAQPSIEMLSENLTAQPNRYFSVMAVAHYPNGKPLQVGIENAPSWATFWSFDNGTDYYLFLYGTPGVEDVGVYSNVRFTVSSGKLITTQDLDLAVAAEAGNTLSLSWLAPTENEDGTPLTDLAGYRIYAWGPHADASFSQILHTSYETRLELSGLQAGLWKFALTAYNSVGVESRLSAVLPVLVAETTP